MLSLGDGISTTAFPSQGARFDRPVGCPVRGVVGPIIETSISNLACPRAF